MTAPFSARFEKMDSNNLQVRWKQHQIGVMDYLRQLLISQVFVDVTLCCQNKRFKAHRILLSACSSYLQKVLVEHLASDHVTIILPDIQPDDMQWILDFMYTGSAAVPKCRLSSFLQAAAALDIKVLTDIAQKQTAAESDSVVYIPACSPALDIKLTKHPNFQNDFINSNKDSYYINPYNLTEDFKHSACRDDAKIPSVSSGLTTDKQEFKSVTEGKKSCVFKCSMENLSYVPRGAHSPLENKGSCKVTLNASSSYDNLSKRTETNGGAQGQGRVKGEDSSSKGVVVENSGCDTKIIHNSVDGNQTSIFHSSENIVLPYLEEPLQNNLPYDTQHVTGNINTNHNPTPSPANDTCKSVNLPQANTGSSNNMVPLSEEYGLKLSSCSDLHTTSTGNDKIITSNSTDSKYGQDSRITEELPLTEEHRSCQFGSTEHCVQYSQRLSQWPKPLPSLMPISNNNPHYNGQIPPGYLSKDGRINGVVTHKTRRMDRKDTLPEHFQNMKDVMPNNESEYQASRMTASGILLTEHRCVRSMWLSGRGKLMHLNGHKHSSDCRPLGRQPQIVPRLSPIVPPSPWVQHHRPPCATPVTFPPRGGPMGFNYQPGSWITSKQILAPVPTFVTHVGAYPQTPPLLMPPEHNSSLGDITRLNPFTQVPSVNPRANIARSPSPHTERLKSTDKNSSSHLEYDQTTPVPKRASESIDMFCKLKERRLQEFYREQMTKKLLRTGGKESQNTEEEAASDLSTKCSQSPHSNSARSSPSDYHKVTSPPTVSLQQKLKILSETSSPKLFTCDEMLTCKENVRKDGNTTIKRDCDSDGKGVETKKEQVTSVLMEDTKSHLTQLTVTAHSEHEKNHEGREYLQEDGDLQILNAAKRTTFTKNDSNNNNRDNGTLEESAQSTPIAKSHECEDCGKCFSRRQLLVQHRRIHTGERPYSCADCGRQFTQRGHWSTHQKLHEPARRPEHACPSCGKAFVTRASLKVHLRTHTGEKPFQCGECGKQFSQLRNYKYHRSVHEGTREFAATCPECGKYFNDRGYLSSHMKIHRNRKEYGCQYCGKSFNQRVAYNMHVRIHTGERPHSCPHCNKSFSRKMLLKQHLRIHTGEKPFACSVCGKAFADRSNMTLHMRLHSGIKPYSCQLCSKAFTKKHHLKTHLNYHTGTKPYSCSKCGLRFSQSSNMRTHYKKCTSTGLANAETTVDKTEGTTAPGTANNSTMSPPSSPGRIEVTVTSPRSPSAVITPPHSDESSCASSVTSRNAIEVRPA